ncbi:MAG: cell division protein FtsA [Vulcanimicrobiaceae bacterium]
MKSETIAGLDIGTTKTCAVVATTNGDGLQIIGVGEAPSTGLRKGVITDLEETIRSIEAATERAERMAGVHISHVYVGVTGEHMQSANGRGVVAISGADREVLPGDVRRCVDASKLIEVPTDRQIIHALPRTFSIDGHDGVADPVGMSGSRLEVDTHIISGSSSFIANVLKCVHRAGLETAGLVFEPLASSASTLRSEERHVGVVLLDVGGGTTDIAVYSGGGAIFTSTLPIGGNTLSNDISLGLKTTFAEAERIKRAYGFGPDGPEADAEFTFTLLDGRTSRSATRAQLRAIAMPRVLETLRLAKAAIEARVSRDVVLAEVVLTGGGAHLRGIESAAAEVFDLPVRIGIPNSVGGLTDAVRRPEYATAVGLVLFGPRGDGPLHAAVRANPFSRLAGWFGDFWN